MARERLDYLLSMTNEQQQRIGDAHAELVKYFNGVLEALQP